MAVIVSGASPTTSMIVDPTAAAARVNLRPNEVTGSFRATLVSGTIAASTVAGVLYTFKYTGTGVCIVRSIQIGHQVTTLYTQGSMRLGLYVVRGPSSTFTQGTTNGTLTTFSVNKKRTSLATPNATAVIATTTVISNDSATGEDPAAYAHILLNMPITVTTTPVDGLRDFIGPYNASAYPLVLAQNEGFRIKNDTAFPAAGAGNLVVTVEWEETTSY